MKRYGRLFERVASFPSLCAAARRAARGKALSTDALRFLADLEPEVLQLERELLAGTYAPRPYHTFPICDPKPRNISAAAFRDRVVHHAVCAVLEPIIERDAIHDSYACRRGKGMHVAVRRVQSFTRRHAWFLALDVEHFFETADHAVLKARLRRKIKDPRLLDLIDRFIDHGCPGSPPGKGLPIGNLTSQHFANFYLGPFDRFAKSKLRVPGYVRFMDDVLLFGPDRATIRAWSAACAGFARDTLRLRLRKKAERRGPVHAGVPFLGLRIWPRLIRFDSARVRRVRRHLRALRRPESDDERLERRAESVVAWTQVADAHRLRQSVLFDRRVEP